MNSVKTNQSAQELGTARAYQAINTKDAATARVQVHICEHLSLQMLHGKRDVSLVHGRPRNCSVGMSHRGRAAGAHVAYSLIAGDRAHDVFTWDRRSGPIQPHIAIHQGDDM